MRIFSLAAGMICCFLSACAQPQGFTIKGELEDIANKEVYLLRQTSNGLDTLARSAVKDNRFELKGTVSEPAFCQIVTGPRQALSLFVENTDMTVGGSLIDPSITGSESQRQLEEMSNVLPELKALREQMISLAQSYNKAMSENNQAKIEEIRSEATKLMEQQQGLMPEYQEALIEYVQTTEATHAVPYMILNAFKRPDAGEFLPAYEKFPEAVQNSLYGKLLKERLDQLASTSSGEIAPEITGKTPEGTTLSLSEIKGKVTLIDFWASWCAPCRQENPNVVRMYKKYHPKGFNILGVSLDEDAEKWKAAIEADGLEWHHVSDLKGWQSALSAPYAVDAIPYTVLLDEEGRIIATNLRGEALEAKLAELLGE